MYVYLESEVVVEGGVAPSGLMNLRGKAGPDDDPVSFARRMAIGRRKCIVTEDPVEYKGQIQEKGIPFDEVVKHAHKPTMDLIRVSLGLA